MPRETKRPLCHYIDPELNSLTGPNITKRTKTRHTAISPELSLATLSIHETTSPSTITTTTTTTETTGNYTGINQYLRQIHIERFGDPELRERWWERYDNTVKNKSDKQNEDTTMMDLTGE